MPAKKPKRAEKKRNKRDRYADLAAEWDRRRDERGAGDWLVDKPEEIALDAVPFLGTLRVLGYVTQDKRFHELHRFVMTSGLVEIVTTGRKTSLNWSRPGVVLSNPSSRDACEMIERMIAARISKRLAIAEAVVALNIG